MLDYPMYDILTSTSAILSRQLAGGGGEDYPIDYTVLKVAILTLGLLLIVELIRHRLDVAAEDRPFFTQVLEVFYRELATLGIVEFGIFLLHQYNPYLDLAQEALFAQVHFMLFYTAILNAIQSIVLAVTSFAVSQRKWVTTEQLDFGHYIAIRREFDEIEQILLEYYARGKGDKNGSSGGWVTDELAEETFDIKKWWRYIKMRMIHPNLSRRYHNLLVQVRFHELRYHFIMANKLPLKFMVSGYLRGAQLRVLIDLVHISSFAWLTLMGLVNLIYFLMSIVAFYDPTKTGRAFKVIFISCCALFVFVSLIIVQKVTWIFSKIMHMKLIDTKEDDDDNENQGENDELDMPAAEELTCSKSELPSTSKTAVIKLGPQDQRKLFWGHNPRLITGLIQILQFGFSLFTSLLLIFWKDVHVGPYGGGWTLGLACLISWGIFVAIMAHVIPRFSLCTNLGQLVDRRLLREYLAEYYLAEALRKRQKQIDTGRVVGFGGGSQTFLVRADSASPKSKKFTEPSIPNASMKPLLQPKLRYARQESDDSGTERGKTLADLVLTSTQNLPKLPPTEEQQRRRERKMRRQRAVSDGVSVMRKMANTSTMGMFAPKPSTSPDSGTRDDMWLDKEAPGYITDGEEEQGVGGSYDQEEKSREAVRKTRRSRRKVKSAGVALMRSPISALYAEDDLEGKDALRDTMSSPSNDSALQEKEDTKQSLPVSGGTGTSDEERRPVNTLHAVLEEIPSRNVQASALLVPLGREGVKHRELGKASAAGSNVSTKDTLKKPDPPSTTSQMDDDDNKSDENDIPVPRVVHSTTDDEATRVLVAGLLSPERLREFLVTGRYRQLSGVCGTLFCFFMVAVRMEVLLIESHKMKENPSVVVIPGHVAFWFEVTWLVMFILISIASFCLFLPRPTRSGVAKMCIAAVLDILVSGACLAMLLVAEGQRTTGTFGSEERLVDGPGKIEPCTSLIALRVLRFYCAARLNGFWKKIANTSTSSSVSSNHSDASLSLKSAATAKTNHGGAQGERGTALELWRTAIAAHPEIVDTYGAFSTELLQTMLGMPIIDIDEKPSKITERLSPSRSKQSFTSRSSTDDVKRESIKESSGESVGMHHVPSSLQLHGCYADLPPETKAIIFAGIANKPIKLANPVPEAMSPKLAKGKFFFHETSARESFMSDVKYEFDLEKLRMEDNEEEEGYMSMLVDPNASLIRSMRRCERRILPILDKWGLVDVVVTELELVLLDAADDVFGEGENAGMSLHGNAEVSDSDLSTGDEDEKFPFRDQVRDAIAATGGGKKLRLRDITAGRRIVGHVAFSTVEEIKVERRFPLASVEPGDGESNHGRGNDMHCTVTEYWKTPKSDEVEAEHPLSFQQRWERVEEDRLKIRFKEGTLYLRFLSDLEDGEIRAMTASETKQQYLPKNHTFLWCQTIGRLCGKEQLKQKLPHFGDLGDDELNDYVEVVDRTTEDQGGWTKLKHRVGAGLHRRASVGSDLHLLGKQS